MVAEAYAKINIGLIVGERMEDGYHEIESYMALIDLCDVLDMRIEPSSSLSVSISRDVSYLEDGGRDLIEKAAAVFSSRFSITFALSVDLKKRIPVRAGLGGGSADAAAVLRFLFRHFGVKDDILKTAALVGSDVPFLASGFSQALVTGRGETVRRVSGLSGTPLLLFTPEKGTDTGNAYAHLDSRPRPERHLPPLSFPDKASFPNDFELVSPLPRSSCGFDGAYVSLTGSGSAWYAMFPAVEDIPRFSEGRVYRIL